MSRLLPLVLLLGVAACRSAREPEWLREDPAPRATAELSEPSYPAWRALRSQFPDEPRDDRRYGGRMTTRIHDVRDLTFGIPSFAAPEIGDLRPVDERPDHGQGRVLERTSRWDEDELVDLIRRSVAPETWDEAGVSITIQGGRLIVRHRG